MTIVEITDPIEVMKTIVRLESENVRLKRALAFARSYEDEHGRVDWDVVDALLEASHEHS